MRKCNLSLSSERKESQELAESRTNLMTVLSAANVFSYFYESTKLGKIFG